MTTNHPIPQEEAIRLILTERLRQDKKWGEQNHNGYLWSAILTEEVGEFAKAVLDRDWSDGTDGEILAEAVQCAAVALAIVECIVRNNGALPQ